MRQTGIAGLCTGMNLSHREQRDQVSPDLLRDLTCTYPNHV
jgi:hypothetical protein